MVFIPEVFAKDAATAKALRRRGERLSDLVTFPILAGKTKLVQKAAQAFTKLPTVQKIATGLGGVAAAGFLTGSEKARTFVKENVPGPISFPLSVFKGSEFTGSKLDVALDKSKDINLKIPGISNGKNQNFTPSINIPSVNIPGGSSPSSNIVNPSSPVDNRTASPSFQFPDFPSGAGALGAAAALGGLATLITPTIISNVPRIASALSPLTIGPGGEPRRTSTPRKKTTKSKKKSSTRKSGGNITQITQVAIGGKVFKKMKVI
jgi:hypothetical protein